MRFLITAGKGFIGPQLSEQFLGRGHEVTIVEDLSTGSSASVEHGKERPGFSGISHKRQKSAKSAQLTPR